MVMGHETEWERMTSAQKSHKLRSSSERHHQLPFSAAALSQPPCLLNTWQIISTIRQVCLICYLVLSLSFILKSMYSHKLWEITARRSHEIFDPLARRTEGKRSWKTLVALFAINSSIVFQLRRALALPRKKDHFCILRDITSSRDWIRSGA